MLVTDAEGDLCSDQLLESQVRKMVCVVGLFGLVEIRLDAY